MATRQKFTAPPERNAGVVLSEYAILGMIMQAPELAVDADGLAPEYFANERAGQAFECVRRLLTRRISPDAAMMQAEIADFCRISDEDALAFLEDTYLKEWGIPTGQMIKAHITIIKRDYARRQTSKAQEKISDVIRNDGLTDEQKLYQAAELIRGAQAMLTTGSGLIGFAEMCELALNESLETASRGTVAGISTGLKQLDDLTSGLAPAQLIIGAARPAMGKTAFAMGLGYNAARAEDKRVLMISMEMNAKQVGQRFLSVISNVHMEKIKKGHLTQGEVDTIGAAIDDHKDVPFHLEQRPRMTLTQICTTARKYHQAKGGLGLLIVDYLQLVSTDDMPGKTRTEQVGEISRGLKTLALELDVPILALSQLNRDVEKRQDKRPLMADLRESGAIEQDADAIIFLYRDEVYNPETIDKGIAEIIVAKQRSGPTGTARAYFDGGHSKFSDAQTNRAANTKTFKAAA